MKIIQQFSNYMVSAVLVVCVVISSLMQAQPGVAQNFVMADAARAVSKLVIAPMIAAQIKQLPNHFSFKTYNPDVLAQSMVSSFNNQTRADANSAVFHEQGQHVNVTSPEKSFVSDVVSGEVGVHTEILTREVLAQLLQYAKLATLEQGGAFRLGMDYFGTTYEVASDVINTYGALPQNNDIVDCTGAYAGSTTLGFATAYANLALSGLIANYANRPLLGTMLFMAVYMVLDPLFKRVAQLAIDDQQCPGSSEFYGFGGDFCYFATGVVPDNVAFAHQAH